MKQYRAAILLSIAIIVGISALFFSYQKSEAAPTRRALLIGISNYSNAFKSLPYPRNDVDRIEELLTAKNYRFEITKLTDVDPNNQPTRKNILAALDKFLLEDCKRGDVCLVYYSGHGSRVKNTLDTDGDSREETIVPIDAARPLHDPAAIARLTDRQRLDLFNETFRDIRDKELAERFSNAVKNGVVLTAIFDSCHSGSIAKGVDPGKSAEPIDNFDLALVPTEAQSTPPEKIGGLILSAARDYEIAGGGTTEINGRREKLSHFTAGLLKTLYRTPADMISSREVYEEVKALMLSDGRAAQTPVIAGIEARQAQSIFGDPTSRTTGRTMVLVVKRPSDQKLFFQKGIEYGLGVGAVLKRIRSSKPNAPPVEVQITESSLGNSFFKSDPGSPAVAADDVFEQITSPPDANPNITVWLPPAVLSDAQIENVRQELQKVPAGLLADEPVGKEKPDVIFVDSTGQNSQWYIRLANLDQQSIGANLTADAIQSRVAASVSKKVFVSLPPSSVMRTSLEKSLKESAAGIRLVKDREQAMYELHGRLEAGTINYAWVLRAASMPVDEKVRAAQKSDTSAFSRPAITDWRSDADSLSLFALRLARLGDLMTFSSPIRPGGDVFPYTLDVSEVNGAKVPSGGTLFTSKKYKFSLKLNTQRAPSGVPVSFRAYLINVDSHGGRSYREFLIGGCDGEDCRPFTRETMPTEVVLVDQQPVCPSALGTEAMILLLTDGPLNMTSGSLEGVRGLKKNVTPKSALNDPQSYLKNKLGIAFGAKSSEIIKRWAVQYRFFKSVQDGPLVDKACQS